MQDSNENEIENSNRIESNRDGNDSDAGFISAHSQSSDREDEIEMPPLEQQILDNTQQTMNNAADEDLFESDTETDDDENEDGEKPVCKIHEVDWWKYNNPNKLPLNGAVRPITKLTH